MTLFTWLIILLLVLVNALYVAAEFAAVGVRKSRIQQLAQEGNPLARGLLPILQDGVRLDRYIAACQIGITISSLVLGAYGQATLAVAWSPLFQRLGGLQETAANSVAAIVVLVFLTAFQVILGELIPKSLALQFPTQTALYTVLPMRASLVLLSWFIAVLNGSGIAILKLLGVPHVGHRHIHSPEEIVMLIAESRDGGLLEEDEHQRLRQALQLTQRTARQIMVPRRFVKALDADTPLDEAVRLVIDSPYTRLPVYQGSIDNVIGMLHTKDLVTAYVEQNGLTAMEDALRPIVTAPATVTAERLLTLMRERRTHQVIVVDEFGGVEGLVTLEDVLAEMLGDTGDEFKAVDQPQPERLPDGRVRLPGMLRVDQAAAWMGTLWEGDADTVGGHVVEVLGHLPGVGERVAIDGVEVEVERISDSLIASLLIAPVLSEEVS